MSKQQVLNAIKALDQPATVSGFGKIRHILNALTYFVGIKSFLGPTSISIHPIRISLLQGFSPFTQPVIGRILFKKPCMSFNEQNVAW